jgi:hypothetical protein
MRWPVTCGALYKGTSPVKGYAYPLKPTWRPLSDNCTDEGVQLKAWSRKAIVWMRLTQAATVRIKVKTARRALENATLVLSVSPEGTGVYKKAASAKRQVQRPVVFGPGHVIWPGLAIKREEEQRIKVKFALTECAAEQPVSVSVSLLYQGSGGQTCAVAAFPIEVSQQWIAVK